MTNTEPASPRALRVLPTSITSVQVIAVLLTIAALELGQTLLAPLTVAILAAVALGPPVRWLSQVMPRSAASAIVVLGIVGLSTLTAYSLADEATALSRRLPDIVRELRAALVSASPRQGVLRQLQQAVNEFEKVTESPTTTEDTTKVKVVEPMDVQRGVMSGAQTIAGYLGQLILLLFLVYFLLASGDLFKQKLVKLGGPRLSHRKVTLQMLDEITAKVSLFVFYQAWSGALVGVITWLCFMGLGMRYAGLWGVAAGVLNCVPYFGPTVVMVLAGIAALLQFHSPAMVVLVAGVSVAVTSIEGLVLAPVMLGQAAKVNSVAVFVALMFWGWLWGALGLIIAVPVLMIIKTVVDRVDSLAMWSELLDDRQAAKTP